MEMSRESANSYIQDKLKRTIDKNIFIRFVEDLRDRIHIEKINTMFNVPDTRSLFSNHEFYWIFNQYNKLVEEKLIKDEIVTLEATDEFSKSEIEKAHLLNIDNTETKKGVTFDNVIEVVQDSEYMMVVTYQQLADLQNYGITTYNFETQREASYEETKWGLLKKPTIYPKNVDAIAKSMLEGTFVSNMISLNALLMDDVKDVEDQFKYDKETKRLTIYRADIIDGFHRQLASTKAVTENPNVEGKMYLRLTNRDVRGAMDIVYQEAQGAALSDSRKRELENNEYINITKTFNTLTSNEMFNKIGSEAEAEAGEKYVSIDTFTESLKDNFLDLKARDVRRISVFLRKFYNNVVFEALGDEFDNVKESRKNNFATENNMFYFYNYLAAKLYETTSKEFDFDSYLTLLEEVDFSDKNPVWNDIKIKATEKRAVKKMKRQLYAYALELIEDLGIK